VLVCLLAAVQQAEQQARHPGLALHLLVCHGTVGHAAQHLAGHGSHGRGSPAAVAARLLIAAAVICRYRGGQITGMVGQLAGQLAC
jgi:hypothetical protein